MLALVLGSLLLGQGTLPVSAQIARSAAALLMVAPGDAAGIQPAINAARDAGGGAVYLPAAAYALKSKLRVHSNVTVFGDGMDQTILRWAPGIHRDHMISNANLADGNENIQIRDLMLDGQGAPSGRSDCCFGLRLTNVRDSYVIDVAVVGHSKDGIYLGQTGTGGAVNVRVSGCLVGLNGRNGISVVSGQGVVIDHCQVENDGLTEKFAGIDIEPDEGLSVADTKLIANVISGQNVGVKLYVPFSGFATVANTTVCQNTLHGNRVFGLLDHNTWQTVYVDNATGGSRNEIVPGPLVGSNDIGACDLPSLPERPAIPIARSVAR